jgi:hypothetical protein
MAAGKEEDWLIGSKQAERGKVKYRFLSDGSFEEVEGGRRGRAIRRSLVNNHVDGTEREEMSHQHLQIIHR